MSYILDALKKAEHQRDIGRVPGIGSEHQGTTTATPVNRWVYVLLLVLIVNAGLLVYALWPESASSTRPVSVSPTRANAPPTPRPAVPTPTLPPPVEPPASAISATAPEVASPQPPADLLRPLPPLPPLPEPVNPVRGETAAVTGSAAQADVQAAPARAPVVAATIPDPDNNLPIWPQVSGQLFQEINSNLRMDVHVYSEHPQERFVLINLQKYNEGERLQEGPVVDAITPEGVILSYRGQRFRVQAK